MSYIYHISDQYISFTFNRKSYHTPCKVTIKTPHENKKLKEILNDAGIVSYKVTKNNNHNRLNRVIPLGRGDGVVSLNSTIKK